MCQRRSAATRYGSAHHRWLSGPRLFATFAERIHRLQSYVWFIAVQMLSESLTILLYDPWTRFLMRVPSVHRVSAVGDVVYEFISRCIQVTFFFISGMVQICCACNDKNANHAEGGTSNSIDGRFTPSDNKSVANSDSSIVRFKVPTSAHTFICSVCSYRPLSQPYESSVSKEASRSSRRDSRPNTPPPHETVENGHGQYP